MPMPQQICLDLDEEAAAAPVTVPPECKPQLRISRHRGHPFHGIADSVSRRGGHRFTLIADSVSA